LLAGEVQRSRAGRTIDRRDRTLTRGGRRAPAELASDNSASLIVLNDGLKASFR
jgi:hypothetical protein